MFGGKDDAGGAEDGVDAGGEHAEAFPTNLGEVDFRAFGAADPVALHREDAVGPAAFQLRHVIEQLVGERGDAEEPLIEGALLNGRGLMAPAAAVHYLLV